MILGLHHTAMSSPDVGRLARFYCEHLGFERASEFAWPQGFAPADAVTGLEGSRARGEMLRLGTAFLELFEFATPSPRPSDPDRAVCDHGITHICIRVDDLDAEYARLNAAGMVVMPGGIDMHCHIAGPKVNMARKMRPEEKRGDAVVPRTRLPEILERICEIADRYGLKLSNVFHAGDGNLHPNISFDRRDPDELERVIAAGEEILRTCVEAGGVISGEHGIGSEKRDYMGLLFSEADLDAMIRLRAAFDPDRVCNPGKIFPTTRFCTESNPKARGYDAVPIR